MFLRRYKLWCYSLQIKASCLVVYSALHLTLMQSLDSRHLRFSSGPFCFWIYKLNISINHQLRLSSQFDFSVDAWTASICTKCPDCSCWNEIRWASLKNRNLILTLRVCSDSFFAYFTKFYYFICYRPSWRQRISGWSYEFQCHNICSGMYLLISGFNCEFIFHDTIATKCLCYITRGRS